MPAWMRWTFALLVGFAIIMVGFRWAPWLLTAFFVMNCLVLIIVVLLQSGKAADLAGAFGGAGSQTAFGPRGAATVLSQATTWCAVMFMVCSLALVVRVDRGVETGGLDMQKYSKPAPAAPAPVKTVPMNVPVQTPSQQQPAPQSSTPQQPAPAPAAPSKK